jgi:hypothetical protein
MHDLRSSALDGTQGNSEPAAGDLYPNINVPG